MPTARAIVATAFVFEGGLGLLAWVSGWLLDAPPLANVVWRASDVAVSVAATTPLAAGLWLLTRYPVGPFRELVRLVEETIAPLFRQCSLADLALIALAAGIGEEMLFRGFLQGVISGRYGPGAGLAAASLLFGLAHPITRTYAVLAAVIGCYLGWLWMLTGNLLVPILVHTLYDFFALAYLVKRSAAQRRFDEAAA